MPRNFLAMCNMPVFSLLLANCLASLPECESTRNEALSLKRGDVCFKMSALSDFSLVVFTCSKLVVLFCLLASFAEPDLPRVSFKKFDIESESDFLYGSSSIAMSLLCDRNVLPLFLCCESERFLLLRLDDEFRLLSFSCKKSRTCYCFSASSAIRILTVLSACMTALLRSM